MAERKIPPGSPVKLMRFDGESLTALDGTPARSARLLHPGAGPEPRNEAMGRLETMHSLARETLVGLSEAGLHHEAEHVATLIDSIDDLRTSMVEGQS